MVYPAPPVHAQHPFRNRANHDELMDYIMPRLCKARDARDSRVQRFIQIDKQFHGWMALSEEDKKRQRAQERTGKPIPTEINLPLSYVHIDDMMTYYAQTFSPNQGMFYHKGKPDEVSEATQLVTLMNNHAIYTGMYRDVLKAMFNILKYNEGGFHGFWMQDYGPRLDVNAQNQEVIVEDVRWRGNKAESIDVYNWLYEPTTDLVNLYKDGEYSAIAEIRSEFWIRQRAASGLYFGVDEALSHEYSEGEKRYFYRHPPSEAHLLRSSSEGTGPTNWMAIVRDSEYASVEDGHELVKMYIRLNPTEFGLVEPSQRRQRNRIEIWQLTILNGCRIIGAQYMNNMHGYIPHFAGRISDDLMDSAGKSAAEILNPLQNFASFLLNAHIKATRKNLYGTTYYDPTRVDLNDIPDGEVSARIPIKASGHGQDLRTMIFHDNQLVDTKQTLQDLDAVMGIINQFFPTQALPSQIAGIDRAVSNQVTAVQQGTNRRQQKNAQLLDICLFRPLRFCFFYNILQYQPDNVEVSDFHGRPVKIDLKAIANTDLPFVIGQGLKVLDRQASAQVMNDLVFALIQSNYGQQVDLMGMINYLASMQDIDIDLSQFARPMQTVQTPAGGVEQIPGQAPTEIAGAGGIPS